MRRAKVRSREIRLRGRGCIARAIGGVCGVIAHHIANTNTCRSKVGIERLAIIELCRLNACYRTGERGFSATLRDYGSR